MFSAFLQSRALLSVSGDDAVSFLQGLVSNNTKLLLENNAIYSALLSPQGKFLHDFFLIPFNGKIFIDVSAERAEDLLSKLKIYRLRSKIEISKEEDFSVAVFWSEDGKNPVITSENDSQIININNSLFYLDPRNKIMGIRSIGKKEEFMNDVKKILTSDDERKIVDEVEYELFRISSGMIGSEDMIIDKSLLLEADFEKLHGVDFSKGCYIGQEVTARSKFRGHVKKGFYRITANADLRLPAIGTPIVAGENIIGEIRTSINNIGIALLKNEPYKTARDNNHLFLCDNIKVAIKSIIWS
ncbi:MAG: hypothetical protein R3D71_10770 [Rickettsiales bacterium]